MAAIAPTVGDVTPIGNTNTTSVVQAGEALTQLQAVYLKAADGKYWRADNNGTLATATVAGLVVTKADAADDYFIMISAGNIDPGATVVVAMEYVLGTTAGEIEPIADLTVADNYTRIGYGVTATNLKVDIAVSGVVKP